MLKQSPGAPELVVNGERLLQRLFALADIGAIENGGCCRLALTDADRQGRDLVLSWMRDLGLELTIDRIGNVLGIRRGLEDTEPVMTGSHIDTVATGGKYDGNLGVLAGLEIVAALNDAGVTTRRPLAIGIFTNEEGARYAPDMLGSLVYAGGLSLDEALAIRGIDGTILGEELTRIGYAGQAPCGAIQPYAHVELHIEQGPILDTEGITIGAVHDLQGISWQEVTITGQSNHAGTTPMYLRRDAGYCAAAIACEVRRIARELGGGQVGTVGSINLHPNLINVIAAQAKVTVDLRNTDEAMLREAERRFAAFLEELADAEKVKIDTRRLARFEPVIFDEHIARLIEESAEECGFSHRRMTSGAGHDAQMISRLCPTAMIFVPSRKGISHNPAEFTEARHLEAGANVLLATILKLAA